MKTLRRITKIVNIPKFRKYAVVLSCNHKYIFDHSVNKIRNLPINLPCKICFKSHK